MADTRRGRGDASRDKKQHRQPDNAASASVIDFPAEAQLPVPTQKEDLHSPEKVVTWTQDPSGQGDSRSQKLESQLEQLKKAFAQLELLQKKMLYHFLVREHEKSVSLCREWSKWLWKQVNVSIDGMELEGILTEIRTEYITLVAADNIYVIPCHKIAYIRRKA